MTRYTFNPYPPLAGALIDAETLREMGFGEMDEKSELDKAEQDRRRYGAGFLMKTENGLRHVPAPKVHIMDVFQHAAEKRVKLLEDLVREARPWISGDYACDDALLSRIDAALETDDAYRTEG